MRTATDHTGDGFRIITWILERTSLWDADGCVAFESGNHRCNVHLHSVEFVPFEFWYCGERTCAVLVPVDYEDETTVGYFFSERGKEQLDFLFAKGNYMGCLASMKRIEDWTGREEDAYDKFLRDKRAEESRRKYKRQYELESLFDGKTLYRNGRRLMRIVEAVEVPRIQGRVCLYGHDFNTYRQKDVYMVVEDWFFRQMQKLGHVDWQGALYEVRNETKKEETK